MNKKHILFMASVLVLGTAAGSLPMSVGAQIAQNPVPTVNNIFPLSLNAGSPTATIIVNGTSFVSNSVVNFNGVAKPTGYISSVQLTASIPASDLAISGSYSVTVTNPVPGGGTSNSQVLTVTGGSVLPTITSVSPSSRLFGGAEFVVTVNGSNFNFNSGVNFNGIPKVTTYISGNQLTAVIPSSDVANVGTYLVTVFDPVRGSSNSSVFTVTATPTIPNTGFGPIDGANSNGGLKGILLSITAISLLSLLAGISIIKLMKVFLAK